MVLSTHTWSPRVCSGCDCPNHHSPSTTSCDEEAVHAGPTFDSLLRSNDPPSPSEERELRDSISVGEAHIVAIDNHVTALKKLQQALSSQLALIGAGLESLDNERGKVVARIAQHKRLFSPVRRLPPEILFKIFLGTVIFPMPRTRSQRYKDWWDFHPSESALWSIELVCKTWRRAVLDFPELWSSINISLSDDNFSPSNFRYTRRLGRQVARTRCHPVSILMYAGSPQTSFQTLPPELRMLLFSIQDRILSLYLYLPPAFFHSVANLQLSLPILRNLTLLSTDSEKLHTLPRMTLFADAPLLNTLDAVDIRSVVHVLDLPYQQITRYSTYHVFQRLFPTGPQTYDILSVLSKVENLEECDLRCEGRSAQLEENIPQSCQKLRALTLSSCLYACPESDLAQLLDALVVPHLSNLKVHCCVPRGRERDNKTFTAIRGLISRSQSPLTTFHFTHGNMDETDLLTFFRSASSTLQEVKLLDVGPMALTDGILAPLVISDVDNVLLPRLHTLNISGVMQFNTSLLVEMVASRWTCKLPSFQCLRTIQLCPVFTTFKGRSNGESVRFSVLNHLGKYRTEGLELSYRTTWASDWLCTYQTL
ncbi:hypothetical protein ARMSODRAFT_1011074 [Armillaria solidipes]|uniref:Uncharacterized protein n=1 Tax=Armillaria solidipes TaxID=1076256 RepID=A0A2H3CJD4_9AGAR|nr:hypothetical protein ARMSODRAFT_1011074 [Armillaria solidipes]